MGNVHHPYIKSDLLSCFWLFFFFFPAPAIGELSSPQRGTGKWILHHRIWAVSALGLQIHLHRRDAPFPQSIPQGRVLTVGSAEMHSRHPNLPTFPATRSQRAGGAPQHPHTQNPTPEPPSTPLLGTDIGPAPPPGTDIGHRPPRAHRDAPRRTSPGPPTPFQHRPRCRRLRYETRPGRGGAAAAAANGDPGGPRFGVGGVVPRSSGTAALRRAPQGRTG